MSLEAHGRASGAGSAWGGTSLNGATRLHFIVGDPIAQVKSPEGVTQAFAQAGRNAVCVPAHVAASGLAAWVQGVSQAQNVDGLIVTVPHKFAFFDCCASTSARAQFLGAVNALRRRPDGGWHGDMFDGLGFVQALQRQGASLQGQRALLVGAGGAGSAIAHALLSAGVRTLAVHDADVQRRDALLERLARLASLGQVQVGSPDPSGFDLVVNASPMGMRAGDPLPLDASKLQAQQWVACVITSPAVPPLLEAARTLGCPTLSGSQMFAEVRDLMVQFLLGTEMKVLQRADQIEQAAKAEPGAALPSHELVVIGGGGAGLATALFAALAGARVLVVERSAWLGGTTAWSAGTSWIPLTEHAAQVNPNDSLAQVSRYLDLAVGEHASAALRQAFLRAGPAAVRELAQRSELHLRPYPKHPDYLSELEGSTLCGRALEPLPFDGRLLGCALFALLRPPIPEFTVLGGMMVDRTDINHLLAMTRSWASFKHACKLLARHAHDRLSWPRGTRLVMGNAHVARLLHSLAQHPHVTLALNTTALNLPCAAASVGAGADTTAETAADTIAEAGERVLTLDTQGQRWQVRVGKALVLASGGFNRHPQWRERLLPGVPPAWSPAAPGHTGQAHELAQAQGAVYGQGARSHAFWAPVSMRQRADGSTAVFPHFVMDRAKPGVLAVNAQGQRFVNESTSYHLFGLAMQTSAQGVPHLPAFLLADARALRQYGLGMVRPGGKGLAPFLADGYLTQAASLPELAAKLGLPAQALQDTVAKHNRAALSGVDAEFARGQTDYQRNLGDAQWPGPNPNLGPLQEAPFYAVRLYPGDIGAATGFATNEHAQVLAADGQPLAGLYAVGNDMQSVMGGVYPAPGITLGPGLVFARIAARHALGLDAS